MAERNLYDLLGVDASATNDEIKAAWRLKVKDAHPDTGGTDAQMHEVQNAYEVLSDPDKRTSYDRMIGFAEVVPREPARHDLRVGSCTFRIAAGRNCPFDAEPGSDFCAQHEPGTRAWTRETPRVRCRVCGEASPLRATDRCWFHATRRQRARARWEAPPGQCAACEDNGLGCTNPAYRPGSLCSRHRTEAAHLQLLEGVLPSQPSDTAADSPPSAAPHASRPDPRRRRLVVAAMVFAAVFAAYAIPMARQVPLALAVIGGFGFGGTAAWAYWMVAARRAGRGR